MSEKQGFLAALAENPGDHVTRRVYADWLEDRGEKDKAAFLRKLLTFDSATDKEREASGSEIVNDAGKLLGIGRLDFTLGQQLRWQLTPDEFMNPANREALFCFAAFTQLCINNIGDRIAELAASPHLRAVTRLRLWRQGVFNDADSIDDYGAQAFANSPHIINLTDLDLSFNLIGHIGAEALAGASQLSRLTRFQIAYNYIGDEGASALAASPYLNNLTYLDVNGNEIGDEGAQALESKRAAAAGRGRTLTLAYKNAPGAQPCTTPKGKWSRHVLQDTDRFLYPGIA